MKKTVLQSIFLKLLKGISYGKDISTFSSSKGNSSFIGNSDGGILVDAGYPANVFVRL